MKDFKSLYLYTVSAITLIVSLMAAYQFTSTLLKDIVLDIRPSYEYAYPMPMMEGYEYNEQGERPEYNYQMKQRMGWENRKNDSYIRLVDTSIMFLIFFPAFLFHYTKTDLHKNLKKDKNDN